MEGSSDLICIWNNCGIIKGKFALSCLQSHSQAQAPSDWVIKSNEVCDKVAIYHQNESGNVLQEVDIKLPRNEVHLGLGDASDVLN